MAEHLNLLQDLLSLQTLPDELVVSLFNQTITLPQPALLNLLQTLIEHAPAIRSTSFDVPAARKLHEALKRGFQGRFVRLSLEIGSNWSTTREIGLLQDDLISSLDTATKQSLLPILLVSSAWSTAIQGLSSTAFITDALTSRCQDMIVRKWQYLLALDELSIHQGKLRWSVVLVKLREYHQAS